MNTRINTRTVISVFTGLSMLALSGAMLIMAQEHQPAPSKGGKKSPHQSIKQTIGKQTITIVYGRPFKNNRKIFGGLEPYGKVWRAGADEATTFETTGDLMVGSLHVVKGKYSMFVLPEEKQWTLILNKTVEQWGAFSYDPKQDYGRAPMTLTKSSFPTEQFTISITPKGSSEGELKLAWDDAAATIPIMVH